MRQVIEIGTKPPRDQSARHILSGGCQPLRLMSAKPFRLAVKAVLIDGANRCLLLRRSAANTSFVGCWEWPGGKVDDGEDFATATVRETAEEAGLQIELTGLAGVTDFEMPVANIVLLCMEARIVAGELRLSHEHDAAEWVPLPELRRFKLPPRVDQFMFAYAARKTTPT